MEVLFIDQLGKLLSQISSAQHFDQLKGRTDFWPKELTEFSLAVRNGMAGLLERAQELDLGWEMNHGYRCDIAFQLFHVHACDNYSDRSREVQFTAATAEGALAGAILLMEQLRASIDARKRGYPPDGSG